MSSSPSTDLPLFLEVLSSPFELAAAARSGRATMPRAVRIGTTPEQVQTLDELLAMGEEHFSAVTRAGLPVVPHLWGLTPVEAVPERRHHEFFDYAGHCLPEGYFLAAEVGVVAEQTVPSSNTRYLPVKATSHYRRSSTVDTSGYQLVEIGSTYGTLRSCPTDEYPKFWMHDIDLYFQRA